MSSATKIHNNAVPMDVILKSVSTHEISGVKRLNGIDKASLKLAAQMLSNKGFSYAECLEEAFPNAEKLNRFKLWATKYGAGTLELACDLLNMILGPSEEFKYWEDKINQRVWTSYHLSYKLDPPTQMELERHFVMVCRSPGMFNKLVAPPIGAPLQIWEKLMEV